MVTVSNFTINYPQFLYTYSIPQAPDQSQPNLTINHLSTILNNPNYPSSKTCPKSSAKVHSAIIVKPIQTATVQRPSHLKHHHPPCHRESLRFKLQKKKKKKKKKIPTLILKNLSKINSIPITHTKSHDADDLRWYLIQPKCMQSHSHREWVPQVLGPPLCEWGCKQLDCIKYFFPWPTQNHFSIKIKVTQTPRLWCPWTVLSQTPHTTQTPSPTQKQFKINYHIHLNENINLALPSITKPIERDCWVVNFRWVNRL